MVNSIAEACREAGFLRAELNDGDFTTRFHIVQGCYIGIGTSAMEHAMDLCIFQFEELPSYPYLDTNIAALAAFYRFRCANASEWQLLVGIVQEKLSGDARARNLSMEHVRAVLDNVVYMECQCVPDDADSSGDGSAATKTLIQRWSQNTHRNILLRL